MVTLRALEEEIMQKLSKCSKKNTLTIILTGLTKDTKEHTYLNQVLIKYFLNIEIQLKNLDWVI